MLAPRETLWAAPVPVVETALQLLSVTSSDTLADYGCGNGVALLTAAERFGCKCVGYEIHEERARILQQDVVARGLQDRMTVHCQNALDAPADKDGVTAVYLYLIERGLSLMLPFLRRLASANGGSLRLVTVLYRLPGVQHEEVKKVQVSELVRTPIYRYNITPQSGLEATDAPPAPS